jgi:hypothetical protein
MDKAYRSGKGEIEDLKQKVNHPSIGLVIRGLIVICLMAVVATAGYEIYQYLTPDPWYMKALNVIKFW